MLKIIALTIIVVVATLLIYAATKPDTFRLQRATTINAPPERIFPFLNDFKSWVAWSPYEKLDTNLKRTTAERSRAKVQFMSGMGTTRSARDAWKSSRPLLPRRL